MTTNNVVRLLVALVLAGACGVSGAPSGADRPTGMAVRLAAPPTLDGDVRSDAAWCDMAPMTDFSQWPPNNGEPASERTEVFMGFTDEALYIGVICYETDPAAIMISNTGGESDSFVALFDTFRTQQTGVAFGTNPVGAEYDGQVSGGHIDWNWSTVWEVRTKINDDSWTAEFEVPFSSLRYGRGTEQRWGVNLERVIRRNNEVSIGRRCRASSR